MHKYSANIISEIGQNNGMTMKLPTTNNIRNTHIDNILNSVTLIFWIWVLNNSEKTLKVKITQKINGVEITLCSPITKYVQIPEYTDTTIHSGMMLIAVNKYGKP